MIYISYWHWYMKHTNKSKICLIVKKKITMFFDTVAEKMFCLCWWLDILERHACWLVCHLVGQCSGQRCLRNVPTYFTLQDRFLLTNYKILSKGSKHVSNYLYTSLAQVICPFLVTTRSLDVCGCQFLFYWKRFCQWVCFMSCFMSGLLTSPF